MSSSLSLISVIVPCFNESEVIHITWETLNNVLGSTGFEFEIIYVDDGSSDDTLAILKSLASKDKKSKVISLSRNFGHQAAVTAGMNYASGDVVVLIDADLQDPPGVIIDMIKMWETGVDVVYGVREKREGESGFKLLTAKVFYRLINLLSDIPIPLDTGDFRLMDKKVVQAINEMPERYRFIRGMVSWVGFKQAPYFYSRKKRIAGASKYPLVKMIRFAMDGILSFSSAPLKLATWLGFLSTLLSCLLIIYALCLRIFTQLWVSGWTLLFVMVLFIGGIQCICLGIIGEYIGRIYNEVKMRPKFLVKEKINL